MQHHANSNCSKYAFVTAIICHCRENIENASFGASQVNSLEDYLEVLQYNKQ